jgi:hypothetical protein
MLGKSATPELGLTATTEPLCADRQRAIRSIDLVRGRLVGRRGRDWSRRASSRSPTAATSVGSIRSRRRAAA